ncbi:MAG: stage II sporulation protein M [Candidatus Paceibacterota bacterium]
MKWLIVQLPRYLAWSGGIFVAGVVLGVGAYLFLPGTSRLVISELAAFAHGALDGSALEIVLFLFMNNAVKALGAMIFGVLFAIAPVAFLLVNGFVVGLVFSYATALAGPSLVLASLLPHGVIELPAMLVAAALGLLLGVHFVRRIRRETEVPITKPLILSARLFIVYLIPLFLVAAVLEVYVTPAFVALLS